MVREDAKDAQATRGGHLASVPSVLIVFVIVAQAALRLRKL